MQPFRVHSGIVVPLDRANVDILLVGDSLGMVVQGEHSTLPVTMERTISPSVGPSARIFARRSSPRP